MPFLSFKDFPLKKLASADFTAHGFFHCVKNDRNYQICEFLLQF